MQTFTLTMGSWLRRLLVRNPLVRASDRIEAAAMCIALASAVLVIPVAGAFGTAIYDNRVHAFASDRLARHEVEATATHDSSVTRLPNESSVLTPLQWQFAGHPHTDIVSTPNDMQVGAKTSIWSMRRATPWSGHRRTSTPPSTRSWPPFGCGSRWQGVAPQAGRCCGPGSIGCVVPLGTVNSTTSPTTAAGRTATHSYASAEPGSIFRRDGALGGQATGPTRVRALVCQYGSAQLPGCR